MSTLVLKIGGGRGIDPVGMVPQIAELIREGRRVVLVHGGSHETNTIADALGHPTQTITSPSGHESRRTDRRTLEIFMMAYCGRINKSVVEALRREQINAVGLSGIDAGIWVGSRKGAIRSVEDGRTVIVRDDLSGRVESVNGSFLGRLLDSGLTPVLTPPAVTVDGIAINVDADRAAAATAAAIGADELLLLSNVPGVLADPADPASLIESVEVDGLDLVRRAAGGRMKNKVLAAEEAINAGVPRVVIGSAGGDDAVRSALSGSGTVFSGAVPA